MNARDKRILSEIGASADERLHTAWGVPMPANADYWGRLDAAISARDRETLTGALRALRTPAPLSPLRLSPSLQRLATDGYASHRVQNFLNFVEIAYRTSHMVAEHATPQAGATSDLTVKTREVDDND